MMGARSRIESGITDFLNLGAFRMTSSAQGLRQPERDRREYGEQRQEHEVRKNEKRDAAVDGAHRALARQAVQDEDDDADRSDGHSARASTHLDVGPTNPARSQRV